MNATKMAKLMYTYKMGMTEMYDIVGSSIQDDCIIPQYSRESHLIFLKNRLKEHLVLPLRMIMIKE